MNEWKTTKDSYQQDFTFIPLQTLNGDELRKDKSDFHVQKDLLCDDSAQNGRAYQLYTLYRDKNGNIQQVTDDTDVFRKAAAQTLTQRSTKNKQTNNRVLLQESFLLTAVCDWWPLSLGTSQWMPL